MASGFDYLLLAFAGFCGSFGGAVAKDVYEWFKRRLSNVKEKVVR